PLIRLVDVGSSTSKYLVCDRLGNVLNFPSSLMGGRGSALAVARALAQVYLYATRLHWGLVQDLIEKPLTRWEGRRGKGATEAAQAAKVRSLEQEFVRRRESDLGRVVLGWGFSAPGGAGGAAGEDRRESTGA